MTNREQWLIDATTKLSEKFKALGHEVPPVRVSIGWPHGGSANTIGQCWPGETATDGVGHIFISPVLADAGDVLAVLVHELVHAVTHKTGSRGHGKEFAAIAKPLGLVGRMTATTAGEQLKIDLANLAMELGDFPHAALSRNRIAAGGGGGRSGKSIKLECSEGEDFAVSISKARLSSFGAPSCPCHHEIMREV